MLGERAAKHGTRGAIFGSGALLERGAEFDRDGCSNARHRAAPIGSAVTTGPTRLRLFAGDPVLVPIEAPVVGHRELVELRAPLEVGHGRTARPIARADLPKSLRQPTSSMVSTSSSRP